MELKVDVSEYYKSVAKEQLAAQLYKEFFTKPVALVRGCYIQEAYEAGLTVKNIYFVDGEAVASSLCPDDYYLVGIGKEFDIEAFGNACRDVAAAFGASIHAVIQEVARLAMDARKATERFDELREYAERMLENVKMEYVDDYVDGWLEQMRTGWHTHHKEGKPCKAKVRPAYWHRIRSFCVRRNYH